MTIDDLPDVPGFTVGKVHDYGDPELGLSRPYYTDLGLTVTVYLYPCPRLPEGPAGLLETEFEAARGGILGQAGNSCRHVSVLGKSPSRLDIALLGMEALHGSFAIHRDEGASFSELILFVCHDQFLKLRCTYPAQDERQHGKALNQFFMALGEACRLK